MFNAEFHATHALRWKECRLPSIAQAKSITETPLVESMPYSSMGSVESQVDSISLCVNGLTQRYAYFTLRYLRRPIYKVNIVSVPEVNFQKLVYTCTITVGINNINAITNINNNNNNNVGPVSAHFKASAQNTVSHICCRKSCLGTCSPSY